MNMILRPRLVALDTSHWNDLVLDALSDDRSKRQMAGRFVELLTENGWVPLIAFHHLAEVMQHENDELVDRRLRFLRSLPLAAWVRPFEGSGVPGDILTVQGTEIEFAYAHPEADRLAIRDLARDALIRFGTGAEAVPESLDDWRILRPALAEMQEHARKVSAISRWRATPIDNTPIRKLMKGEWREPAEAQAVLKLQQGRLSQEIKERGDKRIASPSAMAAEFMREIAEAGARLPKGVGQPPAVQLLLAAGLDMEDIDMDATFSNLMRRSVYLRQLRQLTEELALPWRVVKSRVTLDRLPSAVIQDALREFSQDPQERKGSELNDVYLLCLASYADATYVDKRTLENVRRAKRKVPALAGQLGAVYKAGNYIKILDDLKDLGAS